MAANSGTVVLLITADRIGDQLVDNWSLAAVMSNILCTFAANFLYDDGKLYFHSVIAFGRIHIVEDEEEKRSFARTLGNRYNPNQEEALRKELEHGLSRMLAIRLDIEHLTGKEAIELVRAHSHQPVTTDKKE